MKRNELIANYLLSPFFLIPICIGLALLIRWYSSPPLPSYRNTVICKSLRPDMTKGDVEAVLGRSIGKLDGWTQFESSPMAAGPIRIRFSTDESRIDELWCDPATGPDWKS